MLLRKWHSDVMVVKLRSAVGIGLIWVTAVAGVSVAAWVAIDRAGRDMTTGLVNSMSPLNVGTPTATTEPGAPKTVTQTPTPSAKPTTKALVPAPVGKSPAPQKPSSPTLRAPVVPTSQDRTFSATGGQVSVRCTGNVIQLRIAQPDNGWRVQVENAGPDQIEVAFGTGDEERHGGTKVTAVCVGGTPVFRVESQG